MAAPEENTASTPAPPVSRPPVPAPSLQPVTLREVILAIAREFAQWEHGILGTFIALCWRPAAVARAYLTTRDPRYVKPWRWLVLSVVTQIAVEWFAIQHLGLPTQNLSGGMRFVHDNSTVLSLLILPLVALAMRLFFIGQRVRYVDALLLLFYTQGQTNLLGLLVVPVVLAHQTYIAIAISIGLQLYVIWAWASFGAGPWWRRIGAAVLTLVAGSAINQAIVYVILKLV